MRSSLRRRFRLLITIIIVMMVAVWFFVKFAGAPERRLYALDAASGKVAWSSTVDLDWSSYTEPVVDNGHVIITTDDSSPDARTEHWQVATFDATNGHLQWTYAPFGEAGVANLCSSTVSQTPVVADGHVYVYVCAATDPTNTDVYDKTAIVALDEATGAPLWEHDDPTLNNLPNTGTPFAIRVLGGSVYILETDKAYQWTIDELDEKSGKVVHHFDLPDLASVDPPVLPVPSFETDGHALFLNVMGLTALDPESGKTNYTLQVQNAPWTAENGLYASSSVNNIRQIIAYNAQDGSVRWQRAIDTTLIPDAHDNDLDLTIQMRADAQAVYVFVAHHLSEHLWLAALNPADGSTRWVKPVQIELMVANVLAKVATSPDLVVYNEISDGTGIRALAASDGSERWFFPAYTQDSSPATDGQRVYLFDESARYRNWLVLLNPAWHG